MGKGLAYQFKLMYPEMNKDYVNACKRGDVVIGRMHTYQTNDKLIINFPTKNQWRKPSKMEYIKQGIEDLIRIINEQKIKSIAIPPLGSGNGGLDWSEVRDLLSVSLGSIQDVDIAYQSVKNEIISKKVNDAYESMQKPLQKAIAFVNSLTSIKQVECVATVLFIVQQADGITEQEIINQFTEWSQRKAEEFTIADIKDSIELLLDAGYIEETLVGYAHIVA